MRVAVIFNPTAGHGRAARRRSELRTAFSDAGIEAQWHETAAPGDAVALARTLAATHRVVVAVGGDGTFNEVAQGLVEAGAGATLGLVPCGTGNDFVKTTGTPRSMAEAVAVVARGRIRMIDYGVIRFGAQERVFLNGVGIGFDAEVGRRSLRYKRAAGRMAYALALASAVRDRPRYRLDIVLVDEQGSAHTLMLPEGVLLAAVGNGQYSGGLFRLTPEARLYDGALDLCLIRPVATARLLRHAVTVMRGRHAGLPEVTLCRFQTLGIKCAEELPIHIDGEVLMVPGAGETPGFVGAPPRTIPEGPAEVVYPVDIAVVPRTLPIFVP